MHHHDEKLLLFINVSDDDDDEFSCLLFCCASINLRNDVPKFIGLPIKQNNLHWCFIHMYWYDDMTCSTIQDISIIESIYYHKCLPIKQKFESVLFSFNTKKPIKISTNENCKK